MSEVTDEAIIYQLEKVDQGGDITGLFEDRLEWLANELGFEIVEDDNHPYDGYIRLPGNRYATLRFFAEITERRLDLEAGDMSTSDGLGADLARAEDEGMISHV